VPMSLDSWKQHRPFWPGSDLHFVRFPSSLLSGPLARSRPRCPRPQHAHHTARPCPPPLPTLLSRPGRVVRDELTRYTTNLHTSHYKTRTNRHRIPKILQGPMAQKVRQYSIFFTSSGPPPSFSNTS
jgi:hypothetical protein